MLTGAFGAGVSLFGLVVIQHDMRLGRVVEVARDGDVGIHLKLTHGIARAPPEDAVGRNVAPVAVEYLADIVESLLALRYAAAFLRCLTVVNVFHGG